MGARGMTMTKAPAHPLLRSPTMTKRLCRGAHQPSTHQRLHAAVNADCGHDLIHGYAASAAQDEKCWHTGTGIIIVLRTSNY